jgi:hypothetical protein
MQNFKKYKKNINLKFLPSLHYKVAIVVVPTALVQRVHIIPNKHFRKNIISFKLEEYSNFQGISNLY